MHNTAHFVLQFYPIILAEERDYIAPKSSPRQLYLLCNLLSILLFFSILNHLMYEFNSYNFFIMSFLLLSFSQ